MDVESEKIINFLTDLREQIKSILSETSRTTKLINVLAKIIHYKDVLFYTWKILMKTLIVNNKSCDTFMLNVLELLEKISINKAIAKREQNEADEILDFNKGPQKFILDVMLLKKYVRKVWQILINMEMSSAVHKKMLFVLLELYLSNLENPLFLTDFLISSMNVKGVVRILALQGVATLMQKHNIEYPNIYGKLYTLFEPSIFHTKYKSRLFYLANIFLSSTVEEVGSVIIISNFLIPRLLFYYVSYLYKILWTADQSQETNTCLKLSAIVIGQMVPLLIADYPCDVKFFSQNPIGPMVPSLVEIHLPENLVASFVKRASRLSLTCATPDVLIILRFIGNLLIRHSGLIKMIHHPCALEVLEDPFLDEEKDPMKTRASESSLWEISLLNDHCQPSISSAAKFIHCKLPSLEFDLAEVLDNSFEKLFEAECKKTKKIKPSLTFQRPQETIAKLKDDKVYKLWCLTN